MRQLRKDEIERFSVNIGFVSCLQPGSKIWLRRARRLLSEIEKSALMGLNGHVPAQSTEEQVAASQRKRSVMARETGNAYCMITAQSNFLGALSAGLL